MTQDWRKYARKNRLGSDSRMPVLGFAVDVAQGEFTLSDELCAAEWFDKDKAVELLGRTSVGDKLIKDILTKGI